MRSMVALIVQQCLVASQVSLYWQVEGEQFVGAISEALEPRMRLTGEMATLQKFNVRSRM